MNLLLTLPELGNRSLSTSTTIIAIIIPVLYRDTKAMSPSDTRKKFVSAVYHSAIDEYREQN